MGNNHLRKSLIPKDATSNIATKFINEDAAEMKDFIADGNDKKVLLSLRYIQYEFQCFSDWSKQELGNFWDFNKRIHETTWQMIYNQATKELGNKTGYGYTKIPINKYPATPFVKKLSPDLKLFELRVNGKIRVHGFRTGTIFNLCWLDKNHKICQ